MPGLCLGLLALLFGWLWTLPLGAAKSDADPRIVDLSVAIDNLQVLLSFSLAGAFDEQLRRRIESGLPTSLGYQFELTRTRKRWFDKRVILGELQVVAMYNGITREYLINYKYDGNLTESRVVRDPQALEPAMTELYRFPAFQLDSVADRQNLRVRVRAEVGTRTVFFFVPTTAQTPWAEAQLELP